VPVDAWGRAIDPRAVRRIDQQALVSVRPTLDPLTLTPLRNAVIHSAWGRGKIDLPPGIAKKLYDTRVVVSTDPGESRFRKDLAKSMRVERVSDQARNEKLRIKDERPESPQPDIGRKQDVKEVQQQARQLERQQRQQEKAQRKGEIRVKGEAVAGPAKAPRPLGPIDQPEQRKAQRKAAVQVQGERVGRPAKAVEAPRPARPEPRPEPARRAAAPQQLKHEGNPAGARKQEGKPPGQPSADKGKGKGKRP
jgi:hypothetical protein